MADRDTFQLMPSTASGTPDASRSARSLPFGHENEVARAHYYGVTFDNGLKAEIAPTDHAAAMRFTYPDTNANVIFDNVNNGGGLTIDPATGSFSGLLRRRARAGRRHPDVRLRHPRRAGHGQRQPHRRRRRQRHPLRQGRRRRVARR